MTSNVSMFTDDTHIFVYDAIVDEVEDHLNSELERIHQWLLVNKLTLNKDKTEYVIIGSIATPYMSNTVESTLFVRMEWIRNLMRTSDSTAFVSMLSNLLRIQSYEWSRFVT